MATHKKMLKLYLTDKLFENVMDAVKVFLWKINKLSNKDVNRYQLKKTQTQSIILHFLILFLFRHLHFCFNYLQSVLNHQYQWMPHQTYFRLSMASTDCQLVFLSQKEHIHNLCYFRILLDTLKQTFMSYHHL